MWPVNKPVQVKKKNENKNTEQSPPVEEKYSKVFAIQIYYTNSHVSGALSVTFEKI